MILDENFYTTKNRIEINRLGSMGIDPVSVGLNEEHCYKKTSRLFLSLADLYHQQDLQKQYAEMEEILFEKGEEHTDLPEPQVSFIG